LRALLAAVQRLEDLAPLVRAAGHLPFFQELPTDRWSGAAPERAALLGSHAGFEWLGFETSDPPALLAGRLTRGLERAGRLAAVLALNVRLGQLVFSVSQAPRPLLVLDLKAPSRLALHCLARLPGAAADGGLGAALHLAHALDADAVGRRFFEEFGRTLGAFRDSLPRRVPLDDRHSIALLQLTRLLFLYFVQAKGWLAGRPAFLREQLDLALGRRVPVHQGLFRPLFFGTLNQPLKARGRSASRFGDIPFLNGGLFEAHGLEKRWRADFPDECWREAFDSLFERFHFTPDDGHPDRIAPDMLGRVFEGVMAPEERSGTGTYYTPALLVTGLVSTSLAAFLAERFAVDLAEGESLLARPTAAVRDALDAVTVLDPAVGSGAFLLGALQVLGRAATGHPHLVRRRILSRNLYGVDLNPTAVRLTELRLWLALIDADPAESSSRVEPLPNLDSIVRQGDSLIEPTPLHGGWRVSERDADRIRDLRRRVHEARGSQKHTVLRQLRLSERALLDDALRSAEDTVAAQVSELVTQGRSATLFGEQRGLLRREKAALTRLRAERRQLWRLRRQLTRDGTLPWFHFQSQFAEVFAERGGFDLVVGNPPWVRAEALPGTLRRQLAGRYRWWRARGHGPGYSHQPDFSIAFLERSHELVREAGTVGLLLPAKLATAGYARAARAGLTEHCTVQVAADLTGDPRAGFDATAYPLALITTRRPATEGHQVRRTLDSGTADLPQAALRDTPWALVSGQVAELLRRVREGHPRLDQRLRCRLGVKTGANHVFLDPPLPLEPELLCWAIRGRDVRAFRATPTCRLLWTHDASGRALSSLPPRARAWIDRHRIELERRRDYRGGPLWTLFRTEAALAPHRVVWADLAARLEVAVLSGAAAERLIPLNSCYVIPATDGRVAHRLAAWLNSTWVRILASAGADPASGGYKRFNARIVGGLPLPPEVLSDPRLERLGEERAAAQERQAELDRHCAELLGLSRAERATLASEAGGGAGAP